jgi:hypothetical protein
MKEKDEKENIKAARTPQESTTIKTEKINKICQTLGIAGSDIAKTLQKKPWIENCIILLVAAVVTLYSYAMLSKLSHYGGISSQDFNTIGQLMYTAFGRIF